MDEGRMLSKELEWNHEVIGFSGAGSVLEYTARLDDHIVTAEIKRTAAKTKPVNSR
jgi:hypothetical protein